MDSRVAADHKDKRVRKVSKKEIGAPVNFNHVSHVGWDHDLEGFVLAGASNPVVEIIREAIPRLREPPQELPPSGPDENRNSESCSNQRQADSRCYVCWNHQKDRVLFPCGHCFCHECADRIDDTCFTCRAQVVQIIPLYY